MAGAEKGLVLFARFHADRRRVYHDIETGCIELGQVQQIDTRFTRKGRGLSDISNETRSPDALFFERVNTGTGRAPRTK